MILRNKLTKEMLDIPYSEFIKKFAKEIQDAFESYRKTQLNKYSWNFKDDNSLEFIFTLNYIGISIILEIVTGILNALINIHKWTKSFFKSKSFFFKPNKVFFPTFIVIKVKVISTNGNSACFFTF